MFSGIVEEAAKVVGVEAAQGNLNISVKCSFVDELKIDQSVSHNGVCLTVVSIPGDGSYSVTAVKETLDRSNLGDLRPGALVNLERSMRLDGRLDGHIVQGHVDTTAICSGISEAHGSWYFSFSYDVPKELARKGYLTVEKGSVCVNGVSLTVCDAAPGSFKVAIIPYTFQHTNFCELKVGSRVNIEFDILGKYLAAIAAV